MGRIYKKDSFEAFRAGKFGCGGQNLYVSRKGVLQRIFNYDVTGNGYPDIPVTNSHGMCERPPFRLLSETAEGFAERKLPSEGTFDGTAYDLCGDGYDDLIIACQNNGTHTDVCGIIYHGGPGGLSLDSRNELPAGDSLSVAAGCFDGKKPAICFIRGGGLRIFYQDEIGFNQLLFTDIDIAAVSGVAADIDGDGYDDLYLRCADGSLIVLWGSAGGLSKDNRTVFGRTEADRDTERSTTAARRHYSKLFRCNVVNLNGKKLLFAGGKSAAFYSCDRKRAIVKEIELSAVNAVYALSGRLSEGGDEDLVILCSSGKDDETDSYMYPGGDTKAKPIRFPTRGAMTGTIAALKKGNVLFVAQDSTTLSHDVLQKTLSFSSGKAEEAYSFYAGEPQRIAAGRFNGTDTELAVLDHESGRVRGDEMVYIYEGGPWEYGREHVTELPGFSSVDMHLCDFNDDGRTDVLITNCSENWPQEDPGSFLCYQDESGFDPENIKILPTVRAHGAAVGDFRHSGYLDIAFGGICNREIRIFKGGPDGYSAERTDRIVLGPDDGSYRPIAGDVFNDDSLWPEGEEALSKSYGEVRWLYTADFDGDGWLDLFVSTHDLPYAYIFFGGPDGFSAERHLKLYAPGAINCTVADLNKNGYPDLILSCHYVKSKTSYYETYLHIYWGGPDGYSENRKTLLPTHCANSVTVGDYSGSGWLDIYATTYNNGRERDLPSYVFRNDRGHFDYRNRYSIFNHSGSGCISGDFNGSGYTDLVVANHKEYGNHMSDSRIYWGGPGGVREDRCTLLPSVGPHGIASVDPGNILDRGPAEYYESECLEVPPDCEKVSLSYKGESVGRGYVVLQWRFAGTKELLGAAGFGKAVSNNEAIAIEKGKYRAASYRLSICAPCSAGNVRITEIKAEFF